MSLVLVAMSLPPKEIRMYTTRTHDQSCSLRVAYPTSCMGQTTQQRTASVKPDGHSLNSWWLGFCLTPSCFLFSLLLTLALMCSCLLPPPFENALSPCFSHLPIQLFWPVTLTLWVSGQVGALVVEPSIRPYAISEKQALWGRTGHSYTSLKVLSCTLFFSSFPFPLCHFLMADLFPSPALGSLYNNPFFT